MHKHLILNYGIHFLHERLAVCDDIGIAHYFQEMDLHFGLFDLFLVHFWNVDDFHDILFFWFFALDQDSVAEASFADDADLSIILHDSNYKSVIIINLSSTSIKIKITFKILWLIKYELNSKLIIANSFIQIVCKSIFRWILAYFYQIQFFQMKLFFKRPKMILPHTPRNH